MPEYINDFPVLTPREASYIYLLTCYSYEAGDYPVGIDEWAEKYVDGDGGLLNALNQIASDENPERDEAYDAINSYMEELGRQWRAAIASGDEREIQYAEQAHETARQILILGPRKP